MAGVPSSAVTVVTCRVRPDGSTGHRVFQRTQTLLKEYKERNKSNVFADKRFGEYSSSMSPEEKMLRRFALEQQVCASGRRGDRLRPPPVPRGTVGGTRPSWCCGQSVAGMDKQGHHGPTGAEPAGKSKPGLRELAVSGF